MELNREQIVKALECCASPKQMCKDCPMPEEIKDDCRCMEVISRNALALYRELTEENANLRLDVSSYKLERERNDSRSADLVAELVEAAELNLKLTEENERLRAKGAEWRGCADTLFEEINKTKTDTVRNMQERLKKAFNFGHTILEKSICDIINQIAKELLEEN